MKSIKVNIEAKMVSVFNDKKQNWETCNFYEAGLGPGGEVITDRDEIIEHLSERHDVSVDAIEIDSPNIQVLVSELKDETEPNVRMWVDSSSIYWLSENQGPIWIDEHRGIEEFLDENHVLETRQYGEGVGNEGVEWMNGDFENPFHISDFTGKIEAINHFHF